MFGKKSNTSSTAPGTGSPGPYPPSERTGASADRSTPPQGVNGLLAGQVIDSFNRKPPPTTIQIISTDPKDSGAAPITVKLDPVTADQNGYFTIQNLQPGRQYQLIAKAEDGTKKLAGVTWATPPNPRVTIRISEDFAGKDIPEGPPGKPRTGTGQRTPAPEEKTKNPAAYIGTPIVPGSHHSENSAGTPVPIGGNGGNSTPPIVTSHPEGVVGETATIIRRDPPAFIPGESSTAAPPKREEAPPAINAGPAPVPSCSLTGRTLYNFALNDLDGKPWEFKKDRKGRLTLIDFWGTWCVPCQHAIRHLNDLQWRYGQWGLEVVGIAYEYGTPTQQTQSVKRVAGRLQTNYRLLLGSGYDSDCPVRKQFEVRAYPSLFLLDEKGQIVWQARGGLGERELEELEFEIKKRLNVR